MADSKTINYAGGQQIYNKEAVDAKVASLDNKIDSINKNLSASITTKQNILTFDDEPKISSSNPVTSKGIKTALEELSSTLEKLINAKQIKLTFDDTPTKASDNPVKSNGIFEALDELKNTLEQAIKLKQDTLTFDSVPTTGSSNPVTSEGIKASFDDTLAKMKAIAEKDGTKVGTVLLWPSYEEKEVTCTSKATFTFAMEDGTIYTYEVPSDQQSVKYTQKVATNVPEGWHALDNTQLLSDDYPELTAYLAEKNQISKNGKVYIWLPYVEAKIIKIK